MASNPRTVKAWGELLAKYDWAKKHFDNFEASLEVFKKTSPCGVRREQDPQSGEIVFYALSVPSIPPELLLIAGDAIHNLRSTLDHLAWKLVEANGSTPTEATSLPIFDTPEKYKTGVARKVKGMGQRAIEKIDRLNPYKGGNNELWTLHKLDIVDKHRLILTMATARFAESATPSERERLADEWVALRVSPVPTDFVRGMVPKIAAPRIVKAGDEIKRIPASEADEDVKFFFDVTLREPGITERMNFYFLFELMRSEVFRILQDFGPLL
jgi:hypothetical protein